MNLPPHILQKIAIIAITINIITVINITSSERLKFEKIIIKKIIFCYSGASK